jgi:hypothetical protein
MVHNMSCHVFACQWSITCHAMSSQIFQHLLFYFFGHWPRVAWHWVLRGLRRLQVVFTLHWFKFLMKNGISKIYVFAYLWMESCFVKQSSSLVKTSSLFTLYSILKWQHLLYYKVKTRKMLYSEREKYIYLRFKENRIKISLLFVSSFCSSRPPGPVPSLPVLSGPCPPPSWFQADNRSSGSEI